MTQHTVTGHQVMIRGEDNNEADCFSSVTALHYLPNGVGNDTWTVKDL